MVRSCAARHNYCSRQDDRDVDRAVDKTGTAIPWNAAVREPQRGDFVSTQHVHPSEAPVGASAVRAEIGAFFHRVAESGPQPRLRGLSGICQFNIDGAGTWQATIKKGVVTVVEGAVADPASVTCTITCEATDFLRLVHREGNLNVFAAALQELFTISGDLPFAWAVLSGFVLTPADVPSR
jgi:SCP-2 sterol transfer family